MDIIDQEQQIRRSPDDPRGIKRVQIGCGPHHLRPDWWNTDLRAFPGIDQAMDATKPWPWANVLDYVYAEHFLEHLPIDAGIAFLVEAARALRPGGRIRLSTPALEWVMKTHFTFQPPGSPQAFNETLVINRAFHGWGHKFLYSRDVLYRVLREAGYEDVTFFDYGVSHDSNLSGLELHGVTYIPGSNDPSQWVIEGARGEGEIVQPTAFLAELEGKFMAFIRAGH